MSAYTITAPVTCRVEDCLDLAEQRLSQGGVPAGEFCGCHAKQIRRLGAMLGEPVSAEAM